MFTQGTHLHLSGQIGQHSTGSGQGLTVRHLSFILGTLHLVLRTQGGGGQTHLHGGHGLTRFLSLTDFPRQAGCLGGGQGLHLTQRLHSTCTGIAFPQELQPGIFNGL